MASNNEVEVSVELNSLTAADIGDDVATSEHEKEMKIKFYDELIEVLKPKQNVIECRAITHGTGSQEILPQCH